MLWILHSQTDRTPFKATDSRAAGTKPIRKSKLERCGGMFRSEFGEQSSFDFEFDQLKRSQFR